MGAYGEKEGRSSNQDQGSLPFVEGQEQEEEEEKEMIYLLKC